MSSSGSQADYTNTGLTTGPHPMLWIREQLAEDEQVWRASDLEHAAHGTRLRIGGMVICRQRPGTAKGFVFISLEDETGVANAIVTPQLFEKERLLITSEQFMVIEGILQNVENVIHVKAERLQAANLPGLQRAGVARLSLRVTAMKVRESNAGFIVLRSDGGVDPDTAEVYSAQAFTLYLCSKTIVGLLLMAVLSLPVVTYPHIHGLMSAPLSREQIKRAGELIEELERIEGELQAIFAGGGAGRTATKQPAAAAAGRKKRTMSPAARERIAAAQRARWAKTRQNGTAQPVRAKKKKKTKRTMSPEARAKIAAAQKRRWAKQRRAK